MFPVIHYHTCPACDATAIRFVLSAKDHTVSGEFFEIWHCGDCGLRFTQDIPDAAGIGPYYQSEDYISHSNTSKGFINNLYQRVRKRTLRAKRKLVEKITGFNNGSLLDVGSGTGAFLHEMKRAGWQVTGLEPDGGARKVASESFSVELKEISRFWDLPAESFDAITLWHVLEHVHELHRYMDQFNKLLRKDGKIFIALPNYTSKDAAIYQEFWAAWDVPRHLYHFSPQSMKQLAAKHGLQLASCKPMWYDSFYISMLSSKYKQGKANLPAAFWNGLRSNITTLADVEKCSSVIYVLGK